MDCLCHIPSTTVTRQGNIANVYSVRFGGKGSVFEGIHRAAMRILLRDESLTNTYINI